MSSEFYVGHVYTYICISSLIIIYPTIMCSTVYIYGYYTYQYSMYTVDVLLCTLDWITMYICL